MRLTNKKGQISGILMFFLALFMVLFIGFVLSVGVAIVDFGADNVLPELQGLGQAGAVNLTQIGDLTARPTNNFIQALPGLVGVLYILFFVAILGIAYMSRVSDSKWLVGLFFMLTIILVLASLVISIMYEDFYNDTGDLGSRLKEQGIMSFLILYSPALFTMISLIGGVIMFARQEEGPI